MSVSDWLSSLLPTSPKVDSSAQLDAAKARSASSTPQQTALARQKGFPSYQAMLDFERQRQTKTGGTTSSTQGGAYARQAQSNLTKMHPATMLNGVAEALKKANEGN